MKWFNLTQIEIDYLVEDKVYSLIIYDIKSNKRRVKLSKLISGYGQRIQKSCFITYLDTGVHQKLLKEIQNFYCLEEQDNIIIYKYKPKEIISFNQETRMTHEDDLLFF